MTRYGSDLLFFLVLGILIGLMLRQREQTSNPPPRKGRAQRPPMAVRRGDWGENLTDDERDLLRKAGAR